MFAWLANKSNPWISCISNFGTRASPTEISQFTVPDLDGNNVSFEKYKNKCLLIVNTASGCGFTNFNMEFLNDLKKNPKYKDLAIVAFPSNTYNQEPLDSYGLKKFFFEKWVAKYDVYGKLDVKNSEIYKFLIERSSSSPSWNYTKYLVKKDGKTVTQFGPQSGAIIDWTFTKHLDECMKE